MHPKGQPAVPEQTAGHSLLTEWFPDKGMLNSMSPPNNGTITAVTMTD